MKVTLPMYTLSPHRSFDLSPLVSLALPALGGFAVGRLTADERDHSSLFSTLGTIGGFLGGRSLGRAVSGGAFGAALDASRIGAWYSQSPIGRLTHHHASGLLAPLGGLLGAYLGNRLVG